LKLRPARRILLLSPSVATAFLLPEAGSLFSMTVRRVLLRLRGVFNSFDTVQWGADASTHLAATNSTSSFDFYTLAVNAAGVTVSHDFPNVFTSPVKRIHFEPSKNLVYADNGQIVKPVTGAVTGSFITSPSFFNSR